MKRIICLIMSIVLVLSAVPALAADNTVRLNGGPIYIDEDTPSTVWVDQKGGTMTWNKDTITLTFDNFNYDVSTVPENNNDNLGGIRVWPACSVILNGTNTVSCSAVTTCTMGFNQGATISGGG